MKLAESSRRTIEEFFSSYTVDDDFRLPPMRFYTGKLTGLLTSFLRIHGITIGRKIFIAPELLFVNSNGEAALPDDLTVHEIAHALQYQQEGFITFLFKYFAEYFRNLKSHGKFDQSSRNSAYYDISYEREARRAAANFLDWQRKKAGGEPTAFHQINKLQNY